MPNKSYAKGYRYELKCKRALEAEGWTVLRTAGSHGDADLVCYWPSPLREYKNIGGDSEWESPQPLFVQVKVSPTKADREKIERLRRETGLRWELM